ncbi:hypothetical protein RJT34_04928 [Clitoria ternatea]|uniref:H15 domain-containing protein n=1 Tax=Clitoria ternatea TaxID=43366 RepID=A0AAN9Q335_CLITE
MDPTSIPAPPPPAAISTTVPFIIEPNNLIPPTENPNPNHPPYDEMIYTAIGALKEKDGSSKRAIGKYIEQVYKDLPSTHSALLTHHLNRLKSSGLLVMVKKSYKLPGSDPLSAPSPRGRGRPPKPKLDTQPQLQTQPQTQPQPQPQPQSTDPVWAALGLADDPASQSSKRGPGRPRKIGTIGVGSPTPGVGVGSPSPGRRGRPPGTGRSKLPKRAGRPPKPKSVSTISNGLKRRPGRPPKIQSNLTVIPFAAPVTAGLPIVPSAAPTAFVPNGSPRPRGRPRKNAAAIVGAMTLATVGAATRGRGRGRGRGVLPVVRPGRPQKLAVGRLTNPARRPVGRPKGATSAISKAQKAANEDLKKKLEHFQSKVKESLGVLKPYFNHESPVTAIAAIQDLEILATLDLKAPLRDEAQQLHQAPESLPPQQPLQAQIFEQQYGQIPPQPQLRREKCVMTMALWWNLQNLWPFSALRVRADDLRASKQLVSKLNIPDHTKQFIFAVRDPQSQSLVYFLSSLNLSHRSASDADSLIREIKPDAVLVQSASSPFSQIQSEEQHQHHTPLPTSSLGVIKRAFLDKTGRDEYENLAGSFVLREIFGTSFHGPLLAAKKAAEDVGSSFLVIESPSCWVNHNNNNNNSDNFSSLVSSLVPRQQQAASLAPVALKRFSLDKDVRMLLAKALSASPCSVSEREIQPSSSYEIPAFARSIYPLLEDLHRIFGYLPSIGRALAHAQKMLLDVNSGEVLDIRAVSEVYAFRIAVEGLRIALNDNGLQPISRINGGAKSDKIEFSELSVVDKSDALFAQGIRSQTDRFKTIVVVMDAGALAGLRKHWDTPLPGEVKELVAQLITDSEGIEVVSNHGDRKRLLTDKPMVAVGAGATAVLGASSLTKGVPASALMKVFTFKVPASFKLGLSQMQKIMAFAFGPSKVVAPGIATSGAKTSGVMKAALSAEKMRAVTHSVIASAEKTSISVMRTAFYEIMRKRKMKPIGFLPWATFAGSIGTCTGLLMCGDGIECAVESLPAAPSIASLGRGIQHLREASQAVMQAEGSRIQTSIESLINRIKK